MKVSIRQIRAKRIIKGNPHLEKAHNKGLKTACTSACLKYFGIELNEYHYSQTLADVINILRRKGFSVRSRFSSIRKRSTVGSVRKQLEKFGVGTYLIRVDGHVLLLNESGETIVDTDSRKRDRRKILNIYKITKNC